MIEWCLCDTAAATVSWASVDLDGFLDEQRRATDFVETGGKACGKRQPARCLRTTQDKFVIVLWQRSFCTVAYAPMHERICIFCGEYACIFDRYYENHACAGVYVGQVLWTSSYTCAPRSLQNVHMRSCMCSLFHFALGKRGRGGPTSLSGHFLLGVGGYFDRRKDRGVVCVFSILNAGGSVCRCILHLPVYAHTHTHCTDGVLWCEPRGRDETPGGLEESRGTKSRHICIRICVQSTHVYVYARRRDEILD